MSAPAICHACLKWHPAPQCVRNWDDPCVRCGGKRGPGSEAGDDVCFRCFFLTLRPDGRFDAMVGRVAGQGAP